MTVVTMGEGRTPLVDLPGLARRWGIGRLSAKLESVNPTGSYKDRIAAATMGVALDRGLRGWIATSSGNGGAAMSAYGARAGLPGFLCVPADAPVEKLATIRPYGAELIVMDVVDVEVMTELAVIAAAERLMVAITTHAHNAEGMRGADAIGTEVAKAEAGITQVYVPTGGGGLVTATARGLRTGGSAAAVIVCQPAGCAPIARHLAGELDEPVVDECRTAVSGLQLPEPPDGVVAADAVRRSGGWGVAVEDRETWRVQDELAATEGVFVEPAAALGLAAMAHDAAVGRLGPDDHAVVVLTGSGMKDLRRFAGAEHSGTTPLTGVAARVRARLDRSENPGRAR